MHSIWIQFQNDFHPIVEREESYHRPTADKRSQRVSIEWEFISYLLDIAGSAPHYDTPACFLFKNLAIYLFIEFDL